jgi:hypothetical protein
LPALARPATGKGAEDKSHEHYRLPLSIFVRQPLLDKLVPMTMPQLDDDDHIRARPVSGGARTRFVAGAIEAVSKSCDRTRRAWSFWQWLQAS